MSSFVSAGHHLKDPGAVANHKGITYKEADLARDLRDRVIKHLKAAGVTVIQDQDKETLGEYLARIQPGNGSVVVEFHFDAASTPLASGTTALVGSDADKNDRSFAKELADTVALTLGIRNRGVIDETQSHRGRLGLMREQGIVALLEVGFITNEQDVQKYLANVECLAKLLAVVIKKYDDLIK